MASIKISELPITEGLRDTDLSVIEQPNSSTKAVSMSTLKRFLNNFTNEDKAKLNSIEPNANYYLHPDSHPAAMIIEDEARKFVSLAEKENWNDKYSKAEIEAKLQTLVHSLDWKESVNSFADIATTYPNPENGWTVNIKESNVTYRYDGKEWVMISSNSIPLATTESDGLLSKYDKIKLNSIESNANNYRHPVNHPPEIISETPEKQFVTAAQKIEWSEKESVKGVQEKVAVAKQEAKAEAINESKKYFDETFTNHNHDNVYSKLNHNHDLYYSKLNHKHAYQELLEAPRVPTKVSDLENDLGFISNLGGGLADSKHIHPNLGALNKVTETKLIEWDNKSEFSGHYKDLLGKPVIPPPADVTKLYVDNQLALKSDKSHDHDINYAPLNHLHVCTEIADFPQIPTKLSELINDVGFITDPGNGGGAGHIHNNYDVLNQITNPMIEYLKKPFDGKYSSLTESPTNVSHFTNDAGYVTSNHDHDGRYYRKDQTYPKAEVYTKVEIGDLLSGLIPSGPTRNEYGKVTTYSYTVSLDSLNYDPTLGLYKSTVAHNLNTESIAVRILLDGSKDALVDAYKIIDQNSIEVYSETLEAINVLIFTTAYTHYDKLNVAIGDGTVDSFSKQILSKDFVHDVEKNIYKHTVTHNLDTQNIVVRVSDSAEKDVYIDAYRLIDNISIEVYLSKPIDVDVFIMSNGYTMTRRERGELNSYTSIINASEFMQDPSGLFTYNVYHGLGTESILVSMFDAQTGESMGESLVGAYKIIDKDSIQVYSEIRTPIRISVISDKFKRDFDGTLDLTRFVLKTELQNELLRYVPREAGKGLSTNDFTTELKLKLEGFTPYEHPITHKPSDIATDANNRFVSDAERLSWNKKIDNVSFSNSRLSFLVGTIPVKEIDIPIPTKLSELINDTKFVTREDIKNEGLGGGGSGGGGSYVHDNIDVLNAITQERVAKWDANGDYNNLINKPKIPTALSQLVNDTKFITEEAVDKKISDIKYTSLSFEKTIKTSDWINSIDGKTKTCTIVHNLNAEDILVAIIKADTKESLFIPYQVIDGTSIKILSDTAEDIKVNITCTKLLGNSSFTKAISADEWELEPGGKTRITTITHNLSSENLIISAIKTDTKESLFIAYKIIDGNTVKIFNETNENIKLTIICTNRLTSQVRNMRR